MKKNSLIVAEDLVRNYSIRTNYLSPKINLKALDGISFSLEEGKTLAVVGESGCGKSTLARIIGMVEEATSGNITIDQKLITQNKANQVSLRKSVQFVFQDPYSSLNPRQKVGRMLQEPLLVNYKKMTKYERSNRAYQMLKTVGLKEEHYDRYPHMFSGGQRQRLAIARALMLKPKILILDEPTSALDLSIQAQILNLLVDLQRKFKLTYVFISHDLSVVKYLADEVLVMYLGQQVEYGQVNIIFDRPYHPYTKALLSSIPKADPSQNREGGIRLHGELPSPINPPTGCVFSPRCWKAAKVCRDFKPQTSEDHKHRYACFFPLKSSADENGLSF